MNAHNCQGPVLPTPHPFLVVPLHLDDDGKVPTAGNDGSLRVEYGHRRPQSCEGSQSLTPAKDIFGSVVILLVMIRATVVNERDYVDLGLSCADLYKTLERVMGGEKLDDLGKSVCDATNQLMRYIDWLLAPLRDYLRPKDPASSPVLSPTRGRYFTRLSGNIIPGKPGFKEARWITSEDVDVEHLLDAFTTTDANSKGVWDTHSGFVDRLYWRSRVTALPRYNTYMISHGFLIRGRTWRRLPSCSNAENPSRHRLRHEPPRRRDTADRRGIRNPWAGGGEADGGSVLPTSPRRCAVTRDLTPLRELHHAQPNPSRRRMNRFGSAQVTAFLAKYIDPSERGKEPFTISR